MLTIAAASELASAGPALDDNQKVTPTTDPAASPDNLTTVAEKVDYGIDLRLRSVYVPKGLLGLFVERTPGGSQSYGYGVDLVRRRGNLELQLGFEYEHINAAEGVWINKNESVPYNVADYILSPKESGHDFGWFTAEFTFMNNSPINKYVAIRYGGGAGLGIVTGELDYFKIQCAAGASNSSPEPGCTPPKYSYNGQQGQGLYTDVSGNNASKTENQLKYSTPPVFPVVNAIIGLQIRPTDKLVINLEGGIRTLPFIGFSVGYFL